jgi:cytochrome o ubiquinol oxidase subunit 2
MARRPLLALLLLSGCQPAVLDPAGYVGRSERAILLDSMAIMLAIVIPTILATLGFAWWFRAGNARAKRLPHWAYSGRIEMVTWGIPLLTIMLLGGVAWIGAHQLDPAQPLPSARKPIEVQVVSLDWKWLFIYPDLHVASVNELTIPAGTPVHFALTSASVLNAFFVPRLGSMIYTMNGMATQLNLVADAPGDFPGLSSHYSGDGFSDMYFVVHAVPEAQFAAWVTATQASGPTLDGAAYVALSAQSQHVAPYTYRDVAPGIFADIVSQKMPPGPGPVVEARPSFLKKRSKRLFLRRRSRKIAMLSNKSFLVLFFEREPLPSLSGLS